MLPAEITLDPVNCAVPAAANETSAPISPPTAREHLSALIGTPLADVERELIEATIEHCDGSIPRAARMLEVSPSTLYRKLESWSGAPRRAEA
jgi:DNA-binding NtrC family response regulator